MNNQTTSVSFTKAQKDALNKAQDLLDSIISNPESKIDIWSGQQDVLNPNTGEVIGKRITANVDLYVDENQFNQIEKAMSYLSNSGTYLTGTFYEKELIAIKPRVLTTKSGEVRGHVITFTKQNVGRTTTVEQGADRFNKVFADAENATVMNIEKVEHAETASNKRF